jgi:peptidoglycan hydrolase-like protein with peptidoglycan-binding domain
MFNENLGLMLRIDAKNATTPEGCVYDEAHITLDAQVLTSGDMNRVEYPQLNAKMNARERIRTLQQALTLLGYDPGPEDGVEGAKVRAAIVAYRRDRQLKPDISDENVRQIILLDALGKSLGKMNDAYDQLAPDP